MFLLAITLISACSQPDNSKNKSQFASYINDETVKAAIASLKRVKQGQTCFPPKEVLNMLLHYGGQKMARLMILLKFVKDNYITDAGKRKAVFKKISDYFESIYGFNNEITLKPEKEPR